MSQCLGVWQKKWYTTASLLEPDIWHLRSWSLIILKLSMMICNPWTQTYCWNHYCCHLNNYDEINNFQRLNLAKCYIPWGPFGAALTESKHSTPNQWSITQTSGENLLTEFQQLQASTCKPVILQSDTVQPNQMMSYMDLPPHLSVVATTRLGYFKTGSQFISNAINHLISVTVRTKSLIRFI